MRGSYVMVHPRLWYAPTSSTCYFKSTDGHVSNWQFSTTRLNWWAQPCFPLHAVRK